MIPRDENVSAGLRNTIRRDYAVLGTRETPSRYSSRALALSLENLNTFPLLKYINNLASPTPRVEIASVNKQMGRMEGREKKNHRHIITAATIPGTIRAKLSLKHDPGM